MGMRPVLAVLAWPSMVAQVAWTWPGRMEDDGALAYVQYIRVLADGSIPSVSLLVFGQRCYLVL
jgi:hypothetical protein